MRKYGRLRERALAEGVLAPAQLSAALPASWEELALVHDAAYLRAVAEGTLTALEQRRIGFPWSEQMVERSRRSVGATLAAARWARDGGTGDWRVGINLAGGTHHAHAGHGEGFCVFNDVAVAIAALRAEHRVRRVAVIDLDVHQGNGTASIFAADPDVFTFSLHGSRNYPFRKSRSTLDVELPDGADDACVLLALDLHIPAVLAECAPDLVFYLAGADPYREDRLGRLAMTKEGLRARDEFILAACRSAGAPLVVTMAGGYSRDTEDTVDIHLRTLRSCAEQAALSSTRVAS